MGQRAIKRVPLDFDWPQNEVWKGYLSDFRQCPSEDCSDGVTMAHAWLNRLTSYILMLSTEAHKPYLRLHPWLDAIALHPERKPGKDILELTEGLAGRPARDGLIGHDVLDRWAATKRIIKAAGLPDDWGVCKTCFGTAMHPDDDEAAQAWKPIEPPMGDGYQLWETTSEGSPISPVFSTPEALAEWCETNATLFSGQGASYDEWLRIIQDDSVDLASTIMLTYREDD